MVELTEMAVSRSARTGAKMHILWQRDIVIDFNPGRHNNNLCSIQMLARLGSLVLVGMLSPFQALKQRTLMVMALWGRRLTSSLFRSIFPSWKKVTITLVHFTKFTLLKLAHTYTFGRSPIAVSAQIPWLNNSLLRKLSSRVARLSVPSSLAASP